MRRLYVTFVDKDGEEFKIAVNKGDNLLTVAQANDIEMEGKAILPGLQRSSTNSVL